MTKNAVSQVLRRVRRVVGRWSGGFLPEPLAVRSTLATAIIAAVVLLAFSHTLPGLVIGLILAAAVWYMEIVDALTAKASVLRTHAQPSVSSICCLCLGIAGLYANRADHLVWLEWTCLGVLAITGWLASAQPDFLNVTPLTATANLKHTPQNHTPPRIQIKQLLRTIWTAIGITGILAALALPATPWATLAITTITTTIVTWAVAAAWRYADHARWGVLREITRMKPGVVIPYGATATFHAEMWYPYLDQLGTPYYLISLTEKNMIRLAKNTDVPIVVPAEETPTEISALIPDTVRLAYYPHNSVKNWAFRENRRLSHIFVHHGDGDKAASTSKRSARYDYLFVAGQGAIDRYANHGIRIPENKFRIIGRPQTESVLVDPKPITEKSDIVVLYAPTWKGRSERKNYSSLPMGPEIIAKLLARGVRISFRPHPSSRSSNEHRALINSIQAQLQHDTETMGRQHFWGERAEKTWSVADAANAADAMIADVSGVVTDFLQSGKPYAMVSPRWPADEFRQKFPTSRSAYVIDQSAGSIDAALDAMLGDDPLADYRWQRRSYYLGGFDGHESVDRFVEESRKLLQHGNAQATTT